MPTIIVQTGELDRVPEGATLVERIIPSELHSDHYLQQLVERLGWALADADRAQGISTPSVVSSLTLRSRPPV
jgi:hypothetical protein